MALKQKKSTIGTTPPPHAPLDTRDLPTFLQQQQGQDQLRFLLCGSVDDGKSTLIGRLLWEAQQIPDDQMANLRQDSKKFGTQGGEPDFALLVDGLAAEREQGITIDVAYRYFATARRRFIVADTPGHQQYTRNMVTGASTADLAVLLVDARLGLQVQTRRHAYLASLMGVSHLVLAINKMDLVEYDAAVFERSVAAFNQFAEGFGFVSVTAIPLSALKGDNLTRRSAHTPWYAGPTLMALLETVKLPVPPAHALAFPVQWVNRPDATFRGFSGTVAEGRVRPGDLVRVCASGQTALVSEIVTFDGALAEAASGDAVTLRLDRDIDVSRGDVLVAADAPLDMSDQFEATLVWMDQEAGLIGRNYDIKLATQEDKAAITNIKYRVDVNTMGHDAAKSLAMNDIAVCNIATGKALAFAAYSTSKALGSFLLIDRYTGATVALGMVRHNLRRAQNVHRQALTVTREAREALNGHAGKVIWFTGLSGSGKSTIANALEVALHAQGKRSYLLDGDNVRQGLNKDLGFTDGDRVENIRRIAEVAKLMLDAGLIVLASFISPFRREREMARDVIGAEHFLEVYVSTSLEVCEQRDVKGLYKKARSGQLPNMTGINSAYEEPVQPNLRLDGGQGSVAESVAALMEAIAG